MHIDPTSGTPGSQTVVLLYNPDTGALTTGSSTTLIPAKMTFSDTVTAEAETPESSDLGRRIADLLRARVAEGDVVQPDPDELLSTDSDEDEVETDDDAVLAKYDTAERRKMEESGAAMEGGSYPIADSQDLDNAIHAVGRGSGDHNMIRKHIISRAKALGLSDKIPENWNPDGSIKATNEDVALAEVPVIAEPAAAETVESQTVQIDAANPGRFHAVLAVEDERTADDRIIAAGATKWRNPPLPLMLMTKTAEGHDGAEVCGVIESITREGNDIVGDGRFDTSPAGLEAARLVANKVLTGVSIDAGDVEGEFEVEAEDAQGLPTKVLRKMTSLTIGAATVCPFQAIESARIEYVAPTAAMADEEALPEMDEVTAAGPIKFPAVMFANPELEAPTPLRINADGHLFGHAALWGTNHIGFPNASVTPPHSRTSYSHFLTGSLPLEDGEYQPVGTISLSTSHADHALSAREAALHYDHSGLAAAYVNCGEDEHGIWISGVLKPGLVDEKATELSAASISGDWRRIGGGLELVALLAVNVPGFPVAHTRGDEQTALVAAGYGPVRRKQHLAAEFDARTQAQEERFTALEGELVRLRAQLAPIIKERLAERLSAQSH